MSLSISGFYQMKETWMTHYPYLYKYQPDRLMTWAKWWIDSL